MRQRMISIQSVRGAHKQTTEQKKCIVFATNINNIHNHKIAGALSIVSHLAVDRVHTNRIVNHLASKLLAFN